MFVVEKVVVQGEVVPVALTTKLALGSKALAHVELVSTKLMPMITAPAPVMVPERVTTGDVVPTELARQAFHSSISMAVPPLPENVTGACLEVHVIPPAVEIDDTVFPEFAVTNIRRISFPDQAQAPAFTVIVVPDVAVPEQALSNPIGSILITELTVNVRVFVTQLIAAIPESADQSRPRLLKESLVSPATQEFTWGKAKVSGRVPTNPAMLPWIRIN